MNRTAEAPVNITVAARTLKIPPEQLRALVEAGKVPFIRSGTEYRFIRTDLFSTYRELHAKQK